MTRYALLVTASARRHLAAHAAAQTLAGRVRTLVRAAARDALHVLPDRTHFSQAGQVSFRVAAALAPLPFLLRRTVRDGLVALARRSHLRSARLLTRFARGTLRVRRSEDDTDPDQYARLIVDPPSLDLIRLLVGPAPDRLTTLADPGDVAGVVWQGIAAGKDRRAVERDLLGVLSSVESVARRIARTEGLRVATESQLAASEEVADLIAGYQVFSVGDSRVRPEHAERHGRVYMRHPKRDEYGFDTMPRPPVDMPGHRLAHNCRCMLAPVFADLEPVEVTDAAGLSWDADRGLFLPA